MPSRRHHAKTTTGCFACKARRVKCNEARPACQSCTRRNTKCLYPYNEEGQATSLLQPSPAQQHVLKQPVPLGLAPQVFDALDLRLMHRYCTRSAVHLLPSPEATQVWVQLVPERASTHPILHHAILALAAADLAASHATKGPEDATLTATYRARGLYHQNLALPIFQSMIYQQDPTQSNVIFLFSMILIMLAFGNLLSTSDPPTIEDVLQVFALFRGPRTLWDIRDTSEESMTEIIFSGKKLVVSQTPGEHSSFAALDAAHLDEVCFEAANLLKQSWATMQSLPDDVRAMAYFPAMVDETFFIKVANHEPNALLVLKHYAVLLKAHEERWWIGRWHLILVAAIDVA